MSILISIAVWDTIYKRKDRFVCIKCCSKSAIACGTIYKMKKSSFACEAQTTVPCGTTFHPGCGRRLNRAMWHHLVPRMCCKVGLHGKQLLWTERAPDAYVIRLYRPAFKTVESMLMWPWSGQSDLHVQVANTVTSFRVYGECDTHVQARSAAVQRYRLSKYREISTHVKRLACRPRLGSVYIWHIEQGHDRFM